MNLKESFRYQSFLDNLMGSAKSSLMMSQHCLKVTKTHKCKSANPDAEDLTEIVECDGVYYPNDDVLRFMELLVAEKEKLTSAIGAAKASIEFNIDAAVETNKFRQSLSNAVKYMLKIAPSKRTMTGTGYKFNNEGNQVPYLYEIDVVSEEAYDKDNAKSVMRRMISEADKTSAEIDAAMINTKVDYKPMFDVNETFEDVMASFIEMTEKQKAEAQ